MIFLMAPTFAIREAIGSVDKLGTEAPARVCRPPRSGRCNAMKCAHRDRTYRVARATRLVRWAGGWRRDARTASDTPSGVMPANLRGPVVHSGGHADAPEYRPNATDVKSQCSKSQCTKGHWRLDLGSTCRRTRIQESPRLATRCSESRFLELPPPASRTVQAQENHRLS